MFCRITRELMIITQSGRLKRVENETSMAPTFCYRCGDAVEKAEEGGDPWDELAELDALLKRLRLKRRGLIRKVNRFHSPIVRQLPPDITSTIFEFCLPDFSDYPLALSTYSVSSPISPLSLGSICSYWRDIAWSTPSLWSSMVVHNPSKHFVTGIAPEWLTRSGLLPLSIRISSTFEYLNNAVFALVDIINQYSTRWSNLDLKIPDVCYQRFHAVGNHAPILRSIGIHCSADVGPRSLNFQLKSCPRLERASLSKFPMDGSNFQWDNLTHVTLLSMSLPDTFRILRKTPRLVVCQIGGFTFEQHIEPPILSSMRSLLLLNMSIAKDLLDSLVAPHLEEFNLPFFHHLGTEAVITSFFRRSACSLRSLSMEFDISRYFEELMDILQSMPLLTTLTIISARWATQSYGTHTTGEEYHPRSIFQLLAKILFSQSTSLQQGFLPNLKILKYTGKLSLSVHPGNYEDIYPLPPADNAVHGPLQLFKLDLHPATRMSGSLISYISSLAERGVTVEVISGSEDILQSSIDYHRWRENSDWSDNLDSSLFS
jgi:hypothetical protein